MNHYKTLGVSERANPEAIKSSFRRLARENHPDRHPGDRAKETKFRQIAAAYEVVGDPARRAAYDATQRTRVIPAQRPQPRPATPWQPVPHISPVAQLLVKLAELALLSMIADAKTASHPSTHSSHQAYRRRK